MAHASQPKLSHHKHTERGYITWKGQRRYLPGRWPADQKKAPPQIWTAYNNLVRELLYTTNELPPMEVEVAPPPPPGMLLWQAIDAYLIDVESRFRSSPHEAQNIARAMRELLELFGGVRADQFSPRNLLAVRSLMVSRGRTRQGTNKVVNYIRSAFSWMVVSGIVPYSVHQALGLVDALKRGHTTAPESNRKSFVDEATVKATLPHLPRQVAALVEIGLYCGARPSELCRITTGAIDMSDTAVWFYCPAEHKTAFRNAQSEKKRLIPLGPRCQEILRPWLKTDDPDRPLFSPRERMEELRAELRAKRKTRVQPSQIDRSKPNPAKTPGDTYDTRSLTRIIAETCKRHGIPPWSPGQLRKSCAQRVLRACGIEIARATLGHSDSTVTENHYLSFEKELAKKAALQVG